MIYDYLLEEEGFKKSQLNISGALRSILSPMVEVTH